MLAAVQFAVFQNPISLAAGVLVGWLLYMALIRRGIK